MRLLITGADGQLGRHLRFALAANQATHSDSVFTSSRRGGDWPCDLSDIGAACAMLDALQPDVIFNAAAMTAVDAAEDDTALADALNHLWPAALAEWCAQHQTRLIHFSTDYVFSGEPNRPWREDDVPAPASAYGRSKWAGEQAIMASACSARILRTAWLYSALPGNFVHTMLKLAAQGRSLTVVCDQIGSPTWAGSLAQMALAVLTHWPAQAKGTRCLHACNRGAMSWQQLASLAIHRAAALGLLSEAVTVDPIPSSDWPQRAQRPSWSVLDPSELEAQTGQLVAPCELALEQCLQQWTQPPC